MGDPLDSGGVHNGTSGGMETAGGSRLASHLRARPCPDRCIDYLGDRAVPRPRAPVPTAEEKDRQIMSPRRHGGACIGHTDSAMRGGAPTQLQADASSQPRHRLRHGTGPWGDTSGRDGSQIRVCSSGLGPGADDPSNESDSTPHPRPSPTPALRPRRRPALPSGRGGRGDAVPMAAALLREPLRDLCGEAGEVRSRRRPQVGHGLRDDGRGTGAGSATDDISYDAAAAARTPGGDAGSSARLHAHSHHEDAIEDTTARSGDERCWSRARGDATDLDARVQSQPKRRRIRGKQTVQCSADGCGSRDAVSPNSAAPPLRVGPSRFPSDLHEEQCFAGAQNRDGQALCARRADRSPARGTWCGRPPDVVT